MARFSDSGTNYVLSGLNRPLVDSDAANRGWVLDQISSGGISVFSNDTDGLTPRSGTSNTANHYLAGDGTWQMVQDSDTTYAVFTRDTDGLVPHPDSHNTSAYYLGGDGVWHVLPDHDTDAVFTDTEAGLIPAPHLADSDSESFRQYTIRADGRWVEEPQPPRIFNQGTAGLVPAPGVSDAALFLAANGHWRHQDEIIDSDIIIRQLDSLESNWDTENHSIELGAEVHFPATPGTRGTDGDFAEYVVTFAEGPGVTVPLHEHSRLRFYVPRYSTPTFLNTDSDSETDYVDVYLDNPNVPGYAFPPDNALGLRDVMYAILDPDRYDNRRSPYETFIELNKDASDAVRSSNQLVIGVSTLLPNNSPGNIGRRGAVDSENFVDRLFEYNGHTEFDWIVSASIYDQPGTGPEDGPQTGAWPTRATPGTPARDSEVLILDQQIPQFGTTEQGNQTYEPGLVPQPAVANRTANHFLAGDGTWQLGSDSAVTYDSVTAVIGQVDSWFGDDTEYLVHQNSGGLLEGRLELFGAGATPTPNLSAGQIRRIVVHPYDGTHTNVMNGMRLGSVVRVTQGNAEWVGALSAAPTTSAGVFTLQANNATTYVFTGTFRDTEACTFEFRPAPENPVVPGDFVPNAVRSEDINFGEVSPAHMRLDSNTTPNARERGYVPVSGGTGRDDGWSWVRPSSDVALRGEVDDLERRFNAGIGHYPVTADSELVGPNDFSSMTISSDRQTMKFYTRPEDSELWSGFDDLFDDLLFPTEHPAAIHFQLSYQASDSDTEFTDVNIVFESAEAGTNQIFEDGRDSDGTFIQFQLGNSADFATINRIFYSDGHGDAISGDPSGLSIGPGFFRHMIAYDSRGREADLTSQIQEIGVQSHHYLNIPPIYIPIVVTGADSEGTVHPTQLGTGLNLNGGHLNVVFPAGTDDLTWSQVGNNIRLLTDGNTTNPLFINASDTITFVEDVGDNKIATARLNNGSVDSDHLDTDSVYARHLATATAGTAGQYLTRTATGMDWVTESNAIDTDDRQELVRRVDAFGIPKADGLYWSNNLVRRVVVDVQEDGTLRSYTKVLNWNAAGNELQSVNYFLGSHGGTNALPAGDLKATKTLNWTGTELQGTTIT